jgi:hypothetical protein
MTVLGSTCGCKSFSVCLMKCTDIGCIQVDNYFLLMYYSSMKWLTLSLLTNVILKFTLSDISIATSACFGG